MSIELHRLTPEKLEDVEDLLLPVWERHWDAADTDRIFRWRFLDRSDGEALLAYDGSRPVGFIDSFVRQYRTRSGPLQVREPADWYCHPDHRPFLAVRLIRAVMQRPEPILVVGGNATSRRILERLGYRELVDVRSYALPTGPGAVAKALSETFRFPLSAVPGFVARPLSFTVRGKRMAPPFPDASPSSPADGARGAASGAGNYGLAPLHDQAEADWFARAPARMGQFIRHAFETERGHGSCLSRLYEEGGFRAARLLQVEVERPSASLYTSVFEGTIEALLRSGPQWITARFSCPAACEALERLGFRETGRSKAFWWHREAAPPAAPLHLGWNTSDEGLLPYPF